MQQRWKLIALALGLLSTAYVTIAWQQPALAQAGRGGSASTTAAVPSDIGILDPTGPYEVVAGWPKDLSTTPGNEKWTFGAGQGVFAESPDRVYYIQRGSLPIIPPQGRRGGRRLRR